jgi:L-ascorbate metabolism protein UlaG (beta-lactamase superfamily)
VLGPLGHVASYVAYLARRGARSAADHDAARALTRAAIAPGVELRWLGTAGFALRSQGTTILIDPYVTRLPLGALLRRQVVPPDPRAIDRWIDAADAVLVGHTHFDHALDTPAITARFGCKAYGSASLAHLMALSGQAAQAVQVEPYRTYAVGPFTFEFVPSVHSKLALGLATPSSGELTCEHLDDLTPGAYRCGQVWGIHIQVGGVSIYHQGSADLVDDAIRHRNVDIFLCGIAGRRFTPRYLERILGKLEPRLIVPMHYDDFFRPLDAPLAFSPNINLASFTEEVGRVSRDFALATLPLAADPAGVSSSA